MVRKKPKPKPKRSPVKQHRTAGKRKPPIGRRFQKGRSGNPKGRPPVGKSLAEIVRRVGAEPDERKHVARVELVVRNLWIAAAKKNMIGVKSAQLLFDRGWGKAPQPLELSWQARARDAGMSPDELVREAARLVREKRGSVGEDAGT